MNYLDVIEPSVCRMMAEKHLQPARKRIPVRTCVVCRTKDLKRTLTRIVRTETGIQIDRSGKMNGRGAYLCESKSCWEHAVNTNILDKALRTTLNQDDRNRLLQAMPV